MNSLVIAAEGDALFMGLGAFAAVLFLMAIWLERWPLWAAGYIVAILALAAAFFFRDPIRVGQRGPELYLAPVDGRVVAIERVDESGYMGGPAVRLAISAGLLDVRVQRSPVDGVVDYVAAGEAGLTAIGISTGSVRVLIRQDGGAVAPRTLVYVEEGELVDQAEKIGLIRFGSRVQAYLPSDVELHVAEGDRLRAGTTVLARAPRTLAGDTP